MNIKETFREFSELIGSMFLVILVLWLLSQAIHFVFPSFYNDQNINEGAIDGSLYPYVNDSDDY